MKVPLNDDNAEKAKRIKERSMLSEMQKQKMRAAASPGRRQTLTGDGTSPKTPRNIGGTGAGQGVLDAVTPLRKVPILANFEEWVKMATDNVRVGLGSGLVWMGRANVLRRKLMRPIPGTLR